MTDEFFLPVFQTIRRLQSLKILLLHGFKMNENIIEAISQFKNLKKLYLLVCHHENVSTMYPLLNLINLEALDPGQCSENCDSFLMKIPGKLKNLIEIEMCVYMVTDAGVLPLTNLESLKTITLRDGDTSQITDDSIKRFKNIEQILFKNFPSITDDSITRILNNSPNLEYIGLKKKSGVTIEIVQHMINTMKNRTNSTNLFAEIDLPDDNSAMEENLPPNLKLKLTKICG